MRTQWILCLVRHWHHGAVLFTGPRGRCGHGLAHSRADVCVDVAAGGSRTPWGAGARRVPWSGCRTGGALPAAVVGHQHRQRVLSRRSVWMGNHGSGGRHRGSHGAGGVSAVGILRVRCHASNWVWLPGRHCCSWGCGGVLCWATCGIPYNLNVRSLVQCGAVC